MDEYNELSSKANITLIFGVKLENPIQAICIPWNFCMLSTFASFNIYQPTLNQGTCLQVKNQAVAKAFTVILFSIRTEFYHIIRLN